MKNTKLTRSDKDWINGYFVGVEAGIESELEALEKYLKRRKKQLKRERGQ